MFMQRRYGNFFSVLVNDLNFHLSREGGRLSAILDDNAKADAAIDYLAIHGFYRKIRSNLRLSNMTTTFNGSFSRIGTTARFVGGALSEPSGGDSRAHSHDTQKGAPRANPCLLVSEDGTCVGGIRRTSLLYKIVTGQAVLLFGFLAGFGATRAFPIGKAANYQWITIIAASAVASMLFLIANITGKLWLFGI